MDEPVAVSEAAAQDVAPEPVAAAAGRSHRPAIDPLIFLSVLALVALVLLAAIVDLEATRAVLFGLQDLIVEQFAWLFALTVTFLLGFSLWLGFSRFGHVRLGPEEGRPQFSLGAWLSMLVGAGMGIGLVFFGVAEPVLHFLAPRVADPRTTEAAREAMRLSIFHWGLHSWAIYVVLGMSLAYFHFRRGEPLAIRSTLQPLLKGQTHRFPGKCIDILAVLGTLFGLATSLGLGAAQINAGLATVFGAPVGLRTQILIIVAVTACAVLSLVMGLDKGIRRLSLFNMFLAAALLLFVLVAGPTAALLRGLPDHLGNYLEGLMGLTLRTDAFRNVEWQKSWTIFYWAWWLSWAPFVGTFIARISRGRTIREFVVGCLLVPSLLSVLWFGVFGGAALRLELYGGGGIASVVEGDVAVSIYALLANFPFSDIASLAAVLLVAVFFVTSSDSGSFVVDMLTSGGHPSPPAWQRVFWASLEGTLAIVLLLIGGLDALQAGAISMGLPFCVVLLLVAYCLLRGLASERLPDPSAGEKALPLRS